MAEESVLREKVATGTRILVMKGLIGLYGHVSAYDPETKRVYLSRGAGIDKATSRPEDIFAITLSGEILSGAGRLPLEWPIHTAIHAARPELLAVAHLHAPYATLFSIVEGDFRPVTLFSSMFGPSLPLYEEPLLVSTPEQGKRLATVLGDHGAVLLRSHGVVVVGTSVEDVLHASVVLEDNARTAWQAAAFGKTRSLSAAECAAYMEDRPGNSKVAWDYYVQLESRWDRQPGTSGNPLG